MIALQLSFYCLAISLSSRLQYPSDIVLLVYYYCIIVVTCQCVCVSVRGVLYAVEVIEIGMRKEILLLWLQYHSPLSPNDISSSELLTGHRVESVTQWSAQDEYIYCILLKLGVISWSVGPITSTCTRLASATLTELSYLYCCVSITNALLNLLR